ncbi:hypothetical protein PISMIDRAFT_61141, partial [Pisolithus microcarpus 441]
PLPHPPANEYQNLAALNTIMSCPHLFQVITPIDVNHFKLLLSDHPNPQFVHSVCCRLEKGFWPFTHTHPVSISLSAKESEFVRTQVVKEVQKGHFSLKFDPDLLPGMYSMLVHAV